MKRRQLLAWGCTQCVTGLGLATLANQARADDVAWAFPSRFAKPDLASDEGGLWALMDREETRLRRSPLIMREGGLREYLQGVVCQLGASHCPDVRTYPVRTPWFNASMAPNGMMQVWSGLLLRVENEAQLAAVLGHEMAHYLQRHSIEQLRDARSRSAFGQILGVALGGVGVLAQLALLAGSAAYSRDHERQADSIGLAIMKQAGYDPREAAKVWHNLRAELAAGPAGDPSSRSVLFASHPPSLEREQSLQQMADGIVAQNKDGALKTNQLAYLQAIEPYVFDLMEDELRRGQYDETIVVMDRWVARDPKRADGLYFRGEARRMRSQGEDLDLAFKDFQAATQAKPSNAQASAWRSLGYVHQQRGQGEQARLAFRQYLAISPNAPDVGMVQTYLQTSP
jgi:predicted Zn-dependent protease